MEGPQNSYYARNREHCKKVAREYYHRTRDQQLEKQRDYYQRVLKPRRQLIKEIAEETVYLVPDHATDLRTKAQKATPRPKPEPIDDASMELPVMLLTPPPQSFPTVYRLPGRRVEWD
jgi:hypothetical protein